VKATRRQWIGLVAFGLVVATMLAATVRVLNDLVSRSCCSVAS
jgi:hypothetical protein